MASAISVLIPAECGIAAASRFSFLRLPWQPTSSENGGALEQLCSSLSFGLSILIMMEIYSIIFSNFGPSDLSIELTMRGAEEALVVIVLSGSPRVKASMKQRHPCNILPNQLVPCASQQDGDWCGLQSHYVVLEVPSSPWHEAS